MDVIKDSSNIYDTIRKILIKDEVVFFGGFAISLYSKYIPKRQHKNVKFSDFDVIVKDPANTANSIKISLDKQGIENVKIIQREKVGEIIPVHYEIVVGKDTVAFLYEPIACHSYNVIPLDGDKVRVATIDSMLSFYLAFLYTDRPYYNMFIDRIMCMAEFLFDVQQQNRLEQRGLLKRFSINCYGHQPSLEEIRAIKSKMFRELSKKRSSTEYEAWFLNYSPTRISKPISKSKPKSKSKSKSKSKPKSKTNTES
jgi:hypothetical protein